MNGEKHIIKSKTIWGSIFSLLSFIILFFTNHDPHSRYFALSGIWTSILAIIGRLEAKERVYVKRKKNANK